MQKLYIALVDTPGLFAWFIRKVIKINYIHVVLSLDESFQDAYSVGRRNPFIPFFAGFEKEDIYQIYRAFPTAQYKIYTIDCTNRQNFPFIWSNATAEDSIIITVSLASFICCSENPFIRPTITPALLLSPEYWKNIRCSLFPSIFHL